MSEFNYKDFLKNSSFLNEVEEKEEEKFSVDKLEDKVKAILKKEGGAVGVKPLVDAAKELGASKKDLMDVLEKMKSVKTHKDGDIIDTDGLKEDKEKKELPKSIRDKEKTDIEKDAKKALGMTEAEESSLSREKKMVMKLLLDKMQEIENANPEESTRDFLEKTKNMIDGLIISDF
tara:strand:+ start:75 stop:602 length:528 start_codon:yes stop_codon:yes gene_type:complete